MQKISPFLWFDTQAEDAANFYVSVFKNSKIVTTVNYPEAAEAQAGMPAGSVMTVEFELDGLHFTALNGGPVFKFTEAVSFVIDCADQAEVDYYWEKLTDDGGEEGQCGWLKDKFGLSWQVVPKQLGELLNNADKSKVEKVTAAFMQMKKFDIATLQKAAES